MIDRRRLMKNGLAAMGGALAASGTLAASGAGAQVAGQAATQAAAQRFADRVAAALSASQTASLQEHLPGTGAPPPLAALAEASARDFRSGAVLKVRGCVLSRTEVAWCLRVHREGPPESAPESPLA